MRTTIAWTWTGAVPGFGTDGQEQSIEVDAVVRETPRVSAVVTTHPIERGASPADHIRPEARVLSLDGVISDAPVSVPATQMDGASGSQVGGVLQFSGLFERVQTIRDQLAALVESGTLVTIRSGFAAYEGYALVRFEVQRDGPAGGMRFSIDAEQIRIVDSEIVEAPREVRARSRRNRGEQHGVNIASEAGASAGARPTSSAYRAAQGLANHFLGTS